MRINKMLFLLLALSFILNSCVIDTMPPCYCVKNCTNDTLVIELTKSNSFEGRMYWGKYSKNTTVLQPDDTTAVYMHGEKVIFLNCFIIPPDSISGFSFPLDKDTYYVYAIKWQVATHYSREEIRAKRLYDRRVVTLKDFRNRVYEYKPTGRKERH